MDYPTAEIRKMTTSPLIRLAAIAVLSGSWARADVKLPAIISDHMVLEKTAKVPIWGWAEPGEEVTVTLGTQTAKAKADPNGRWMTSLNLKDSAPGPFAMTVEGKNILTLTDVVVGEVWVASGQSNMEFELRNTIDAVKESTAPAMPLFRNFLVKKNASADPLEDTTGRWVAASPQTTKAFSAVGYYFAKKLQSELNVPVGLINASWGATPAEAWTSSKAIDSVPDLKATSDRLWPLFREYPEKKKAFVEGLSAWIKENAREDKPVSDATAYAGLDIPKDGWTSLKLPGAVTAPGLPKAGVVWLRKEINTSKTGAALSLVLPIDGYDSVYWNGTLIKQTTYQDFPGIGYVRRYGAYDILPGMIRDGKNVLAIRLYEPVGPAKFTGDPRAGVNSLGGEWLARTEYEFPEIEANRIALAPNPPARVPLPQDIAGSLFNGMIHPILPYAIRGVIWYQGETNVGRAYQYRTAFPLLIADWREHWNEGDFPFYFCQLANFMPKKAKPDESPWAELREAQAMTLRLPHTGQAVLIDIGESDDIHARNKKDSGERLARIALARDYGKQIFYSGPVYESMKVEGGKVILSFKNATEGLAARPLPATYDVRSLTKSTAPLIRNSPGSELEGFAICGADRKWTWAQAKIDGTKVIVWSDKVPAPIAVRYAWADNPTCNLTNTDGLPASPFRTDDFPTITLTSKY
ncbi:sialate O-acetylesterase [soil metagenome]